MSTTLSQIRQGAGNRPQSVTNGGTGLSAPGANGSVLVSNGTGFVPTLVKTINGVSVLGNGNITVAADQPHNLLMQHGVI